MWGLCEALKIIPWPIHIDSLLVTAYECLRQIAYTISRYLHFYTLDVKIGVDSFVCSECHSISCF